jgi:proline iminopeptidase
MIQSAVGAARWPLPRRPFAVLTILSLVELVGAQTTSLTVPAYNNLPVREGYFGGASDVRLFYRYIGESANPIVFLHGGPGVGIDDGGYDLEPLAAKRHALLLLNERGAGRSEVVTETAKLGIDWYVRDLEALRQHFKIRRMALIGLSWGSAVVAKYAVEHSGKVDRIVFLSPMAPTRDLNRQRAAHLTSMLTEKEIARMTEIDGLWEKASDNELSTLCRDSVLPVLKLYVVEPTNLQRTRGKMCDYSPEALRNMNKTGAAGVASLGDWDFRPILRTIRKPALVIEGEESNVPRDEARAWAASLQDGRLLLIPQAGHMNWLDQPDAVISALDEFFRGKWPAQARR